MREVSPSQAARLPDWGLLLLLRDVRASSKFGPPAASRNRSSMIIKVSEEANFGALSQPLTAQMSDGPIPRRADETTPGLP